MKSLWMLSFVGFGRKLAILRFEPVNTLSSSMNQLTQAIAWIEKKKRTAFSRQRLNNRNSSLQASFVTSLYVATMHLP